jgi:4-hydroxybenzoate polyprenyltransferase
MSSPPQAVASQPAKRALVVDLDGTLVRSDILVEMVFGFLGKFPFEAYKLLMWHRRGRALLKQKLAALIDIDVTTLPYDQTLVSTLRAARAHGRPVYLVSSSDERLVKSVADYLGLFDGWFASDGATDLSGAGKSAKLSEAFGDGSFDYVGAASKDVAVDRSLAPQPPTEHRGILTDASQLRRWLEPLRPHQWAKNALVGVSLLTAHQFTATGFLLAGFAFIAFAACSSSVYVLNDLVDIQADRSHPSKRNRPFARGDLSFSAGGALFISSLLLGFAIAAAVSLRFLGVLVAYFVVATAYSLVLKRKLLVDVITLAGLYTIRVVGGAVAIAVPISQWLLGFSVFMFLCLALIKRYSELAARFDAGLPDLTNRGYRNNDLPVIASLAAASAFSAVIVFSLYLASDTVRALYSHPSMLWLICPLLVYWTSRMLMFSHRRALPDDPLIFALGDRISWATAALIGLVGLLAM